MEQKIDDFNVVITKVIVAHKWESATPASYDCPMGRKSYGLVYVISGEMNYKFYNGKTLTAKAGDVLLLKPNDAYKLSCPSTCQHYTVNFEIFPSSISGKAAKKCLANAEVTVYENSNTQEEVFRQLVKVWKDKQAGYQIQACILSYKLLYDFIQRQKPHYHNATYTKIKSAIEMLENEWNRELSLAILASSCNLSVPHFRHLFSQIFKTSPMEYRDSLRLLYAKDYLLQQCYTIGEIAEKCGFENVNYFSRFFKKHVGVSPSRYALR